MNLKSKGNRSDGFSILMNMIWSVIAVIVNYAINFLITPYVTNNIGVEAYGFVSLATTFTNYIDIISVGLNAFAGRFISVAYHKGDMERANKFYSSTIAADIILSLAVFIPCIFIIGRLEYFLNIPSAIESDVKLLFILVLAKYLFTVLRTAFNTATFIVNRLDIAEKQRSISYIIQGCVLLAMCSLLVPHVWYVGAAGCVATGYLLFVNFRYARKFTPDLHFRKKDCSFSTIKELVSSGIWNSLNSLGNVLNSGLDLLITNIMLSATIQGQVSIGKNLATICYTLVSKISESFRPKQLKLYAESRKREQISLLKFTMKITGFICNVIICVFIICGHDFLQLWIPTQDIDFIFKISVIVLLSDIAIGVVNPLYYVFTLTKKVKIPCIITILLGLANVGSMYLLIKYTSLGAYAVVLTTLVLNFAHFIDTPLYSAHCLKIKYTTFYPTIGRHMIALIIGMVVAFVLREHLFYAESWFFLIVKACISTVIIAVILAVCVFNKSEINKILKKFLKRG